LSEVAKWQYRVFSATPGRILSAAHLAGESFDLIIDALIGYSLKGAPRGTIAHLIHWANGADTRILALDVPSGLDSTTGETSGSVIAAETTVTLALPKTGLIASTAGRPLLADIGIPIETYQRLSLPYVPPFGSRYIVPLRLQNGAAR
jgi:NAD(P)H-hydrate epimerase